MLSDTVPSRRLSFFGHLNQVVSGPDHYRALQACASHTQVQIGDEDLAVTDSRGLKLWKLQTGVR